MGLFRTDPRRNIKIATWYITYLTMLEPQPRFGDDKLTLQQQFQVICPQNGTAVPKLRGIFPVKGEEMAVKKG